MLTNCPRCNVFLAPGAQECPNCRLNFAQTTQPQYQQATQYPPSPQQFPPSQQQFQQPYHQHGGNELETPQEEKYRKILVGVFILLAVDFLLRELPYWIGLYFFSLTGKLMWLTTLAWAGLPLLVALSLPKHLPSRQLMITLASIWVAVRVLSFIYVEFFAYNPLSELGFPSFN